MKHLRQSKNDNRYGGIQATVLGQPPYGIADKDLSSAWLDLVRGGKVSATVAIGNNNEAGRRDQSVMVNYGVRMVETSTEDGMVSRCEEYVVQQGLADGEISQNPVIRDINATLVKLSNQKGQTESSMLSPMAQFQSADNFVAQLQLVRTLRPPPSPGFSGTIRSNPPPYDPETDSFVTGPLRLNLRPLVCRLEIPKEHLCNSWDVFHNVSPADTRGHFLLMPTLSDMDNWRGQILTRDDCNDLVFLASTIDPPGSLMLGYNSFGAGASQNHIHCHAWPCPPIPLLQHQKSRTHSADDTALSDQFALDGWNAYPVSNVGSIYDFMDVGKEPEVGKVEASYLKYPVFCVQLSASNTHLKLLGKAVAACMDVIGDAPHNLSFLNRVHQSGDDEGDDFHRGEKNNGNGDNQCTSYAEDERFVDVYIFARSKERADNLPSLKLGVSEMMGVFHAQSTEELKVLSSCSTPIEGFGEEERVSLMELCLRDVSFVDEASLWEKIKERLSSL